MRIGILREFWEGSGLGGAEYCVAVLAEGLQDYHHVEIIIGNNHDFNPNRVRDMFGISLHNTRFRFEAVTDRVSTRAPTPWIPWSMYEFEKNKNSHISRHYDIFVCFTHGEPPFCHAKEGALFVLFPWQSRAEMWPWNERENGRCPSPYRMLRDSFYNWVWRKKFFSYKYKFSISNFTQSYTKAYWSVDSDVIYPPVNVQSYHSEKLPVILSIGRFTPTKKQRELIRTFASVSQALEGWSFHCLGGLGDQEADLAYFDQIGRVADCARVSVLKNASREALESSLSSASIFWHAVGYGEDERLNPKAMEHFGIVTVEAMAWGCVPVVIKRGGQPEIVRHGVDGFLWETLDELADYTNLLARDESLRVRMAQTARLRARTFCKENFVREVAVRCGIPLPVK